MIDALAEEVATLREENQRLAREHFRPASASRTAAEIRKVAAVLDEHPARGDDGADSAVAIALETEMIRRGLVEVCELLQTMAAQLAASLTNGVPLHEIDRRLRDRPVDGDRRRRDSLTNGATLTNGMLTNGTLTNSMLTNASNGNGNGHSEISVGESHSDAAAASVRSNGAERHLQVLGEAGDPPMMIVKGTPGASDWESPRAAVYDRVARADNGVAEPVVVEEARPSDSASPLGRSGYYDRVQRSDGSATR
ncbi:MAG: hypothetical protein ACLPVY_23405 [Acidimicrobiia bacterium]